MFLISLCLIVLVVNSSNCAPQATPNRQGGFSGQLQGPPQPPQINWGKCPQLEPVESDKKAKADIISSCLKSIALPENMTQETVEKHRTEVARCALNAENWFTEDGKYRYDKAESEIKAKKLSQEVEPQILRQHGECRKEAEGQFPSGIAQIQLYQACMDYHISQICGITIVGPSSPQ
ncbi:uncharacterized protein LOC107360741 [Tetranychus urticae]|uniref:uncharacterized protein LOC107360741 n=1 Tax=Tetranychus urticae TaxID=32264 RepID=UPI00077B9A01|nr:uncharacterized protein LOC107360741 [Tetranychus urticae]